MKTLHLYYFSFIALSLNFVTTPSETKSHNLSRRKRYVVFPEGSSLTVAFCFTVNLIEVPREIFVQQINIGINYDLPNRTAYHLLKELQQPKETARRRNRRELYNKIEIILDAMGLDGKSCVQKALCEVVEILKEKGNNMIEEIVRRIFHFPLENMYHTEPDDHRYYHRAHVLGHDNRNCTDIFPNCHMSLISTLLGYKWLN